MGLEVFGARGLEAKSELARQIFHLLLGLMIIAVLLLLWKTTHGWHFISIFIAWVGVLSYCVVVNLHARGIDTPFYHLFKYMGRRDKFPGEGALWYILGVMVTFAFLDRFLFIISTIYIIAVGDSISTLFSYKRSYKYSFFKGRNWLSYLAFVAFTLPVAIFVGIKAVPLVIVCAIAESLDLKINDNFLIPLICVVYFLLF